MISVAQWILIVLFAAGGIEIKHSLQIPFHSGVACEQAEFELAKVRGVVFSKCYPLGDRETP